MDGEAKYKAIIIILTALGFLFNFPLALSFVIVSVFFLPILVNNSFVEDTLSDILDGNEKQYRAIIVLLSYIVCVIWVNNFLTLIF